MKTLRCMIGVLLLALLPRIESASAQEPSRAETLNSEGKKLIRQLDLEGATERFRQAMLLDGDPRYAFNLCYTLEKRRKFLEARLACERVAGAEDARLSAKAGALLASIEKSILKQEASRPPPAATPPAAVAPSQGALPPPVAAAPYYPAAAQRGPYVQQWAVPQKRTRSYGLQILSADAASWATLLAGAASESEGLIGLGVSGLLLGGTVVHLVQGNSRGALWSVSARLLLPLGGLLVVAASCNDGFECGASTAIGGLLGYGSALALDWLVLAKRTEYVTPPLQPMVQPTLSFASGGAVAGLRFNL